jgi:transposase
MSTSPYSQDLRERVIKYLELGKTQASTAEVFCLNPSTVSRWWLRYKRVGNCLAKKRLGAKPKLDKVALENYMSVNQDIKLKDLSKKFNVSVWTVCRWLKKIGYSYKKKPLAMWKQAKRSEINT